MITIWQYRYSGPKTGIPPHCSILRNQKEADAKIAELSHRLEENAAVQMEGLATLKTSLERTMDDMSHTMEQLPDILLPKIADMLDLKQVQAGDITPELLRSMLVEGMKECVLSPHHTHLLTRTCYLRLFCVVCLLSAMFHVTQHLL